MFVGLIMMVVGGNIQKIAGFVANQNLMRFGSLHRHRQMENPGSHALTGCPHSNHRWTTTTSTLNMGFMDAFKNEDLGKAVNPGLKGGPKSNDTVTINGKPAKAVIGQKLSVVAAAARAPIKYDCRNGDCGTCIVTGNGRKVKACQAVVGTGRTTIETR